MYLDGHPVSLYRERTSLWRLIFCFVDITAQTIVVKRKTKTVYWIAVFIGLSQRSALFDNRMFLCTFFSAVREFVYQIAHYNRKAGPDRLIVNGNEFTETTNFVVAAIISNECSILFETISLIMQREKNRRHEHFNNDDNKYPTLILYRINKNKSSFIKMAVNCIHFDIQNCIPQIFICLLTSSLFINLNTLFLCSERQNWTKKLASKIIRAKIPIEVDAKQNYRKEHTHTHPGTKQNTAKRAHTYEMNHFVVCFYFAIFSSCIVFLFGFRF